MSLDLGKKWTVRNVGFRKESCPCDLQTEEMNLLHPFDSGNIMIILDLVCQAILSNLK